MNQITIAMAAAAWLGSAAVSAQSPPTEPPVRAAAQPAAPPSQPLPAARWTALQIRQTYDMADSDSNGQLSRAEAQRLAILPRSFEDMDQNKDGVLAPGEYEGSFPR